jgi:hypothetical protein
VIDCLLRWRTQEESDNYFYHTEASNAWLRNHTLPHEPFDWVSHLAESRPEEGSQGTASTKKTISTAHEPSFRSCGRKAWSSFILPSSMRRSKAKEQHPHGAGGVSSTLPSSIELSANHTS